MKIRVQLKDPDGPLDSLKRAVQGLSEEDANRVEDALSKWIRSGEYLTIEIDTEADTAEVIKNP